MKTLWLMLALMTLAACTDSQSAAPDGGPESPPSSGVLLDYQRSGGFTGSTDGLTIRADGRAVVEGDQFPSGRFTLSDAHLTELKRELEDLDWDRAADEPPNVVCADCFVYDISSGEERVTTTANGQSGRELGDLLALVDTIIASSDLR
ncbi:MAG: hypothetical protein M3343_07420 [Actinomycetota bacterium]|nr:hypothetical protein [Actinomycetota bacterium]